MTDRLHLLPSNSTLLERAISEAIDRTPELGPGVNALHSFKLRLPVPESVLPWLVIEYGLGPITPYLPDLATVIEYGVRWNRVKGTPQGIREALSWLGYTYDTLYEAPTHRTRWHLFELELDRFWDGEADLDVIEAVVRLSEPARSPFWRGWREYNVREIEWSKRRWSQAIWGDSSGVRLHDGGVKWSFGRTHEPEGGSYDLTYSQLAALGVWSMPSVSGSVSWGAFPWTTPGLSWSSGGDKAWYTVLSAGLLPKSCWVGLLRADGSVIGYRRARAWHSVASEFGGIYEVGGSRYNLAGGNTPRLYVEALTGFGEGIGDEATAWTVVLDGDLPADVKPGVMWLDGDSLVGGVRLGTFDMDGSVVLGQTSRERLRCIVHMDSSTVFRSEPAALMLGDEDGFAVDFAADQVFVRDRVDTAKNFIGRAAEKVTVARASGAGRWNADRKFEWLGNELPRLDHDPVTGEPRGLLSEITATNWVTRSNDFETGRTKVGLTVVANAAVAPDGSMAATRLIETTANGAQRYVRLNAIIVQEGTQFTASVFVRPDANRKGVTLYPYNVANSGHGSVVDFNLETMTAVPSGGFGRAEIVPLADGWFRLTVALDLPEPATEFSFAVYFSNDPTNGNAIYDGDGVSGIAIWGSQVEAGLRATTYVPTEAAPATRATEMPLVPIEAVPYDAEAGTLLVEGWCDRLPETHGFVAALRLATSYSHRAGLVLRPDRGLLITSRDGAGTYTALIGSLPVELGRYRAAVAIDTGLRGVLNGGPIAQIATVADVEPTRIGIAYGSYGGGNNVNLGSHVRSLRYLPRAMSNAELQAWSAL
ncbi:phage head spike fiber domain-containing protein [Aquamicrobium terrae]